MKHKTQMSQSKDREREGKRNKTKLISCIIVALLFGLALYLRTILPYDQVFTNNWVKFTSNDAYYYMRIVDNLVHNFPRHMEIDPYYTYPGATGQILPTFFTWLLATVIWVIGLGSPSHQLVDVVSAYFPAVLGALTVIPVYFIGRALLGRGAGIIAAGLIAVLPGEFLGRSILGFTDHHVAETLLTTVTMLFLILAIKASKEMELSFEHIVRRDWKAINKPLIYSFFTGLFMGAYLLTWLGALLFVFVISVYFIIQFIIDHLKGRSTDYLCIVGTTLFFFALIISLSSIVHQSRFYLVSIVIALLIPLVLSGVSHLLITANKLKKVYYPLSLIGLGIIGMGIFYLITPGLVGAMLAAFSVFTPKGAQLTTIEMQSILFPAGQFTLSIVWGNFNTAFFFSLICFGYLLYMVIRHGDSERTLLVVWSLVMLAATLGQRRFAYYLAVNVALLTGYLAWSVLTLVKTHKEPLSPKVMKGRTGLDFHKVKFFLDKYSPAIVLIFLFLGLPIFIQVAADFRSVVLNFVINLVLLASFLVWHIVQFSVFKKATSVKVKIIQAGYIVLTGLVILFNGFFPSIPGAIVTASQARYAPSDAWQSSLLWLEKNTPDPFSNPDYYYEIQKLPPPGQKYQYPDTAYSVMAWWDYGYWITRIAHRIPYANPGQDPIQNTITGRYFISQNQTSAEEIRKIAGSKYVIIDFETATSKFWAMAVWAGEQQRNFFDVYYVPQNNALTPVILFHPEYYRSLSTRLYNFDAKAVNSGNTTVISYEERAPEGVPAIKVINGVEQFSSYQEAVAFLGSQQAGNYRIVSSDPFTSPVPLEALADYKLVYGSEDTIGLSNTKTVSAVKIFEYTGQ